MFQYCIIFLEINPWELHFYKCVICVVPILNMCQWNFRKTVSVFHCFYLYISNLYVKLFIIVLYCVLKRMQIIFPLFNINWFSLNQSFMTFNLLFVSSLFSRCIFFLCRQSLCHQQLTQYLLNVIKSVQFSMKWMALDQEQTLEVDLSQLYKLN